MDLRERLISERKISPLLRRLGCFPAGCGAPPIMVAGYNGETDKVRRLLKLGADVNTFERGFTPLITSLQVGKARYCASIDRVGRQRQRHHPRR